MKWTGKKNERSASGKSKEYKKYAAQLLLIVPSGPLESFDGLHNAAFSESTTCAGSWNEASCHKLLVLCDKRENVGDGRGRVFL